MQCTSFITCFSMCVYKIIKGKFSFNYLINGIIPSTMGGANVPTCKRIIVKLLVTSMIKSIQVLGLVHLYFSAVQNKMNTVCHLKPNI